MFKHLLNYNPDLYICDQNNKNVLYYCTDELKDYIYENHKHIITDWSDKQTYEMLRDPITYQLLDDPLIASDGITYSRSTLEDIFVERRGVYGSILPIESPMTRQPLIRINGDVGIPNTLIRQMLEKFKEGKLIISN
jgi:hypothetical protein